MGTRSPRPEVPSKSAAVTDDAVLGGRLRLLQPARGHRAGHDAILLAAAAPMVRHAIDLGAGVGTAGLALLARDAAARVTLVERDPALATLAHENAKRNGYSERTEVITADVAKVGRGRSATRASCDLVLANPPFNDPARLRTSPDAARRRAHVSQSGDLDSWIAAAERLLAPSGKLVLIYRPEHIDWIVAAVTGRFGAVEIIPIFPHASAAAIRIIVRAIKGRRTPPSLRPGLVLNEPDGRPSAAAESILRAATPLDPA
jgi:tRNA1(Val) A37 N6-methylase TrmN6